MQGGAKLTPPPGAVMEWHRTPAGAGRLLRRAAFRHTRRGNIGSALGGGAGGFRASGSGVAGEAGIGRGATKLPLRIAGWTGAAAFSCRARLWIYSEIGTRRRFTRRSGCNGGDSIGDEGPTFRRRQRPTFFISGPGLLDPGSRLLSASDPEAVGTLAWLARTCFVRQTRLVMVACRKSEWEYFMRLGEALTSCGGPAVVSVIAG